MSGKRINAHITIMAALSMTIVLSLISACIKSASDCYYNTQIKEACMLSVEAAFSSYHNDMLNEYDIFLLVTMFFLSLFLVIISIVFIFLYLL